MSNSVARFPNDRPGSAGGETAGSRSVSAIDEQAFVDASDKLSRALDQAAAGRQHGDIVAARTRLRELAVKLRDAGYWRTDKHGLRATVSLLWQADRYVSELALKSDQEQKPRGSAE